MTVIKRFNDILAPTKNKVLEVYEKVKTFAKDNKETFFTQVLFPEIFEEIAKKCWEQSMESFTKLFKEKEFYNSVREEIAKAIYNELNQ